MSDGVSEGRCDIETRGSRITDPLAPFGGISDGRLVLVLIGVDEISLILFSLGWKFSPPWKLDVNLVDAHREKREVSVFCDKYCKHFNFYIQSFYSKKRFSNILITHLAHKLIQLTIK